MPENQHESRAKILVVEDEALVAEVIESSLISFGYDVCGQAQTARQALDLIAIDRPDLVLMDIALPGPMDGLKAAEIIRARWAIPVVFLTSFADTSVIEQAKLVRPFGYVVKPFKERTLRVTIEMALYVAQVEKERRLAEEALLKEQALSRAILEATDVMLVFLDRNFHFLAVNDAYAQACRLSPEELIGRNHFDLYPHEENEAIFRQVRDTGEPVFYKDKPYEFPDQPGRGITYWDWSLKPVKDEAGVVEGLVFSLRETTPYKKTELALRESEARFRAFTEHAPVGIYVTDLNGDCTYVNKTWCQMAGLTPEQASGQGWIKGVFPEDLEAVSENWHRSVKSHGQWGYEYRFRGEDGSGVWVLGRAGAILDGDGRVMGYIGSNIDITALKQAEAVLQAQRDTLKRIFEGVSNLLLVVDRDGRVEDINRAGAIFAGRAQNELIGLLSGHVFNCLNSLNEPGCGRQLACSDCPIRSRINHTFQTGQAVLEGEGSLILIKDHEPVEFHLLVSTIPVQMDGQDKVLVTIADISERKQAEQALQVERNNLQAVLDASPVGMLVFNSELEVVLANPAAERLFSQNLGQVNHPRCGDFICCPNRDLDPEGCGHSPLCPDCPLLATLKEVLKENGEPARFQGETLVSTEALDEPLWINYKAGPVTLNGRPCAILAVDDITRQKLAEEALRESEENYELVVNSLHETLSVIDARGTVLFVNHQAARNLSGGAPEDTIGRNIGTFIFLDQAEALIAAYRKVIASGVSLHHEAAVSLKTGDRWFSNVLQPVNYGREKTPAVLSLSMDITERKRAEEALKTSTERYQSFVSQSHEAIYCTEFDQPIDTSLPMEEQIDTIYRQAYMGECNQAMATMYGLASPEDFIGKRMLDFHGGMDNPVNRETFRTFIRANYRTIDMETEEGTPDGRKLYFLSNTIGTVENGFLVRIWGITIDITERKKAEEELRSSEQRFRSLATGYVDGIMVVDGAGTIYFVNPAAEELFNQGVRLREGNVLTLPFVSEDWSLTTLPTTSGTTLHLETRSTEIQWEGRPAYLISIRNVTDRVEAETARLELENRVQNSQRLEAIGVLAGGIAHDFNNILSAIMGYAELATMDSLPDSPVEHILQQIMKAGLRGRDLIQQILSFSRRAEQKTAPLHLSHVVKESIKFMRASLPSTIKVNYNLAQEEEAVIVDPTKIHQVLMNLGTNSAYAMRDSGGTLEIAMRNVKVDDDMAAACVDLAPGKYQELTVSDTGIGIEPSIINRIFDPFFTTKPLREGTGLGLSTTHGIIRSHGGAIRVTSEMGVGTTFKVYLPCVVGEVATSAVHPVMPMPTGTERILFVDDEEALVDVGCKMMGKLGYVVTGAYSGLEALAIFREAPKAFDLIMTDQTMPGLTGVELSREILSLRPDMPIILFTGYSQRVDQEAAMAMGIKRFILKPFVLQEIIQVVRETLAECQT